MKVTFEVPNDIDVKDLFSELLLSNTSSKLEQQRNKRKRNKLAEEIYQKSKEHFSLCCKIMKSMKVGDKVSRIDPKLLKEGGWYSYKQDVIVIDKFLKNGAKALVTYKSGKKKDKQEEILIQDIRYAFRI